MPLYGVAQAGFNGPPNQGLNLTSLIPGESIVLFDGTETPSIGLASVAFARGYSPSANDAGTSFDIKGMPAGMTVDVQAANQNLDAAYCSFITLSPDSNGNANTTDPGRSAFYRLKISAYTSGAMCVGIAQR